jgi:hypothetical protein
MRDVPSQGKVRRRLEAAARVAVAYNRRGFDSIDLSLLGFVPKSDEWRNGRRCREFSRRRRGNSDSNGWVNKNTWELSSQFALINEKHALSFLGAVAISLVPVKTLERLLSTLRGSLGVLSGF